MAVAAASISLASMATAQPPPQAQAHKSKPVCPHGNPADTARCHAKVVTLDDGATPAATSGPAGYGPADLQSAYALSSGGGSGQTIAIVDAYDNPYAESDLATYRSQFGLPPCTTANGCFKKVNQSGVQGSYPSRSVGWGQEIALDLDTASAVCPNCNLLLVEASSSYFSDLATAVNRAATMGADVISNSYGGSEFSSETTSQSAYNHPGIPVTVSTGDSGYGVQYPASSRYVTAVGGTRLTTSSNARGWSETAWSGAGSGCSSYISKPSWQHDSGCSRRTVADVSAVADPNTGVSVYDTYGSGGWLVFGGTSVGAPIIAGVYALGGSSSINDGSYPYSHTSSLNDVTSGNNGSCSSSYLCTAGAGYDGPTGLGTPIDTGAFGGPAGSGSSSSTSSSTTSSSTTSSSTTTSSTTTSSTSTTTSSTTTSSTTTTTAPSGPPSAPRNVGALQWSNPGVFVYWYAPSSAGCSAVTGYRIYRSKSSGAETFLVSVGVQSSYQDTSATSGVRYYYKVAAVNSCGQSPLSNEASAVAK